MWDTNNNEALSNAISSFGFCNCGDSNSWVVIKHLLKQANSRSASFYNETYIPKLGTSPGFMNELVAKLFDRLELLEHGAGIGAAWPTKKGQLILEFLEAFGVEEDQWPSWVWDLP